MLRQHFPNNVKQNLLCIGIVWHSVINNISTGTLNAWSWLCKISFRRNRKCHFPCLGRGLGNILHWERITSEDPMLRAVIFCSADMWGVSRIGVGAEGELAGLSGSHPGSSQGPSESSPWPSPGCRCLERAARSSARTWAGKCPRCGRVPPGGWSWYQVPEPGRSASCSWCGCRSRGSPSCSPRGWRHSAMKHRRCISWIRVPGDGWGKGGVTAFGSVRTWTECQARSDWGLKAWLCKVVSLFPWSHNDICWCFRPLTSLIETPQD